MTEKVTDQLTDTELQILGLIEEDPAYTSSVLAEKLSLSRKTIALWLKKLKEKNVIERIGSDRKGYWKIK